MHASEEVRTSEGGFGRDDFHLLRRIGENEGAAAGEAAAALWAKTRRLADELAAGLFGEEGFEATVWGEDDVDERGPFLWVRLKRRSAEDYATHVGAFLSPGFCNLALDLEKDPLDAGEAAETVDQVLDFYRSEAAALIVPPARPDLRVWTDTDNVVTAAAFREQDLDAFMERNRDSGHPWPKVGYLLDAEGMVGFGDAWLREMHARAAVLVPVYDAMIRSLAG